MPEINIPDEEFRDLLSTQILAALSEETRNNLIEEALKYLIAPDKGLYSKGKSQMQEAFERSLQRLANQIADEIVEERGVADRLRQAMRTLMDEMPDIYDDWELQTALFRVLIEHARKQR